ncbi:unnamed protein product, partial [marine sediment metagenome]
MEREEWSSWKKVDGIVDIPCVSNDAITVDTYRICYG